MSKCGVHGKVKLIASLVATVCVPAKLGHVFAVGSLGCAQKSFGEVAKFLFWDRTKLHKQVSKNGNSGLLCNCMMMTSKVCGTSARFSSSLRSNVSS
jgi:hypothetical protein